MESALLWYERYAKTMKSKGFVGNPYDRCIAKISIDSKQFTIPCYVDNKKSLHIDEHVNRRIIEAIEEIFCELTVSRGKIISLRECT